MLCAIDPGLRHCGVAVFDLKGNLIRATLVRSPNKTDRGPQAWKDMATCVKNFIWSMNSDDIETLVVEVPRIYPHTDQRKGDLNDLIELAGVVGALAAGFLVVRYVYPAQWKGQLPKKVMNQRVWAELTELEQRKVTPASDHNVLDAVGIGLHQFGRIGKARIFR